MTTYVGYPPLFHLLTLPGSNCFIRSFLSPVQFLSRWLLFLTLMLWSPNFPTPQTHMELGPLLLVPQHPIYRWCLTYMIFQFSVVKFTAKDCIYTHSLVPNTLHNHVKSSTYPNVLHPLGFFGTAVVVFSSSSSIFVGLFLLFFCGCVCWGPYFVLF